MRSVGRWILIGALALLMPPVVAQENIAARETATDALKKALEESAKLGGATFKAQVAYRNPLNDQPYILGLGGSEIVGDFAGTLGANQVAVIRIENDQGVYEAYRKADKVLQRSSWKGKQVQVGNFASEATALLDFAAILKSLDKAKSVQSLGVRSVGTTDCDAIKLDLPPNFVSEEDDLLPGGTKMTEIRSIEVCFCVTKETHLVRKIEVKITKQYASAIRGLMAGGKDPVKEDEGQEDVGTLGNANLRLVAKYSFTLSDFNKDLGAEIPAEFKKLLSR